jgi:hypothetical protein
MYAFILTHACRQADRTGGKDRITEMHLVHLTSLWRPRSVTRKNMSFGHVIARLSRHVVSSVIIEATRTTPEVGSYLLNEEDISPQLT